MKILKDVQLKWWEVGIIKWSALFIGVAIGAYWSNIFGPYVAWFALIGLALGFYALYFWLKK